MQTRPACAPARLSAMEQWAEITTSTHGSGAATGLTDDERAGASRERACCVCAGGEVCTESGRTACAPFLPPSGSSQPLHPPETFYFPSTRALEYSHFRNIPLRLSFPATATETACPCPSPVRLDRPAQSTTCLAARPAHPHCFKPSRLADRPSQLSGRPLLCVQSTVPRHRLHVFPVPLDEPLQEPPLAVRREPRRPRICARA